MNPFGPLQENTTPEVEEEAISVTLGWLHMIVPPVAERSGTEKSPFTKAVAELVQPFDWSITVTV